MIASDLGSGVEQLGDMIAAASTIVPFTGAGISTECGIPDFRSPGGLWTRNRPINFDEFVASQDARNEAWRRRFAMEPTFAAGCPLMPKNCGARLVIINNEPTEQDDIADLVIRHDIGETLGPFVGN